MLMPLIQNYVFFSEKKRSASLSLMQYVALEVESNIIASQKVKRKIDRKNQPSYPLVSSSSENKMEKMAKMLDSLTIEMSRLKD